MSLSTQPYKGARDFYPEDKRLQKYMFGIIRSVVESFGFEEYDAPILEPLDLYRAKTGEEIVDEQTYAFTDRGGREVAIRPEMTPTVSRMVAGRRQELAYPVKWYSIPNLWRYERPQRGRLREHWQLNVDIFGIEGIEAEHELILIGNNILKSFGAKPSAYEFRVNSRQLVETIFTEYFGLGETQSYSLVKLIDRMSKIDPASFDAQLEAIFSPSQRDDDKIKEMKSVINAQSIEELPTSVQSTDAAKKVVKLLNLASTSGIRNIRFDMSIMRGFDYYTDIVFEVFDTNPDNNRAMFGGGRYDGLVGLFGVAPVATVGFGMGDVTLQNFLESNALLPVLQPEVELAVVLVGDVYSRAQEPLAILREEGVNVFVDSSERKLDKKLRSLDKKGVRFAMFIGEEELSSQQYVLKDLKTGESQSKSVERVASVVKDYRKK